MITEVFVCNASSIKSLNNSEITICENAVTAKNGVYKSNTVHIGDYVENISIHLSLTNCTSANAYVTLSDEGDYYAYDLPEYRIVPEVESSGYINIHPYGRVNDISVTVKVPEGSIATIDSIRANVRRPFSISLFRIALMVAIALWLKAMWVNPAYNATVCDWKNVKVRITVVATLLIIFGIMKWLTTSNELIVSCPWPHHKQYQELAHMLDQGTVKLTERAVEPALLDKTNPYDTSALMIEGIPYNMDFAYYDGSYYVYFGIIPELIFYYPFYKLTGHDLANYHVMWILSCMMAVGVFLCVWQLQKRFSVRDDGRGVSLLQYLSISLSLVFVSTSVYMCATPDIYNIPVMMATGLTWLGIGLWLCALNIEDGERTEESLTKLTILYLTAGSFCMAMVAGCRPQMILYSAVGVLFIVRRMIFTKKRTGNLIAVVTPYMLVAALVFWYNYARFGSIVDFGATYSMTSNDMNHRGFNFDRLLRGLYSFFFQPAVYTHDFPYITSSVIDSAYMGKNLVEFTYGGAFVTNIFTLSAFAPLFGLWKKMKADSRIIYIVMMLATVIIAVFDVNGAGILYRYTCDYMPGLLVASLVIWLILLGCSNNRTLIVRLLAVVVLAGWILSFLVLLGPGESTSLRENSPVLYESIRALFRF